MIKTVFKITIGSLLVMFFLDLSLFAIDFFQTESKIKNLGEVIQKQVIQNNSIPTEQLTIYNQITDDIKKQSMKNNVDSIEIKMIDKTTGNEKLNLSQPEEYGSVYTLQIATQYRPARIFFPWVADGQRRILRKNGVVTRHNYTTPCLRYLQ